MKCHSALLGLISLCAFAPLCGAGTAVPGRVRSDSGLLACPTTRDDIGRIIAPVMIDGTGPYRFLLDTGANYSMMSPGLAKHLGLTPVRKARLNVTGITGTQRLPWVRVVRLRVGRFRLGNVRMPVAASPVMTGLDGILGLAGLPAERIAVNFRHNIVWIGHSNGGGVWGYLSIAAERTAGGLLRVQARIGDVPVVAIIDTGSPRTLGNEALHRALLRGGLRPKDNAQIFGVTRQVATGDMAGAPTVYLGPAAIGRLDIVYGDIPIFRLWHLQNRPAVIIGMDVLGTVDSLILDYRRPHLYIRPHQRQGVQVMQTYSPLGSPLPGGPLR